MKNRLYDYISCGGKNVLYGLPATEELKGRKALLPDGTEVSFGDELAVKADDDLFLAEVGGKILLIEELPDESLKAIDAGKTAGAADALPADIDGWDSLEHINLIAAVEQEFGVKFTMGQVVTMKNVGEMARLIEEKLA